jgi:hypothetical protein
MEHNKTININPELFKLPEKKTRKRQSNTIKIANNNLIKPSQPKNKSIKTKLLKYIREKQEEKYKQKYDDLSQNVPSKHTIESLNINNPEIDTNDFNQSLEFFNSITTNEPASSDLPSSLKIKEISNTPSHNNTVKHHTVIEQPNKVFFQPFLLNNNNNTNNVPPPSPSLFKLPDPVYGCLKNGKLPTYKMIMNKTRHNNSTINVNPQITISNPSGNVSSQLTNSLQKNKIEFIQNDNNDNDDKFHLYKNENNNQPLTMEMKNIQDKIFKNNYNAYKIPKYLKKKKTFKKTFHLGKSKYYPQVSVLIPNKTIRTKITTQSHLLKQVPIEEVKRYLIMNGFIKVGSTSPDDVLRKIYESVNMIGGEVKNHNSENLLYNYLNYDNSTL